MTFEPFDAELAVTLDGTNRDRCPSSPPVRFVAPVWPWRAAWQGLIHRRSVWIVWASWLVMSIGFGVGMPYAMYHSAAADPAMAGYLEEISATFLMSGFPAFAAGALPFWGAAAAVVIGGLAVGGEYAQRTVGLIHTQGPRRIAVMTSQLVALAIYLGLLAATTLLVDALGLVVVAAVEGWPLTIPPLGPTLVSTLGVWLTALAYGLAGATACVLTRSLIAGVGVGLGWCLGVETVIVMICGSLDRLDLGQLSLAGATSNLAVARGAYPWWPNALTTQASATQGWIAAAVLVGWCAITVAASLSAITRRDI
ncbi:MAG: hypothetical protein LBV06_00880 [Propionibacteriaceae bacterium]|jgi:ABC-type transport system involved in multi-copper enzyme maturation permease subunit|nr:hypothetical protein [Propionibacteriaceae bacterium]